MPALIRINGTILTALFGLTAGIRGGHGSDKIKLDWIWVIIFEGGTEIDLSENKLGK